MPKKIVKTDSVCSAFAVCRETLRARVKEGLSPQPLPGGGYLQSEVDAVIGARAAGWDDHKIRQLVAALLVERQTVAADLLRYLQPAGAALA